MTLQELRDARAKAAHEAREIAKKAIDESRDLSVDEKDKAERLVKEVDRLTGEINQKKADEDLSKRINDFGAELGLDGPAPETGGQGRKSVGRQFYESDSWQRMLKSNGGRFGETARVNSDPVQVKQLLTGADHSGGAGVFVDPDRIGTQIGLDSFQRPLVLRQLVTSGTTNSDTIEYARFLSTTNNAAPVPEAITAAPIGSGTPAVTPAQAGIKPESGFTMGRKTAVVKTIANWLPATKRALSDAAQLLTLIDNFLLYNLEEELDAQMVTGDDVGENFEGIANVSGVQTQAWDTNMLVTTRRAKTKVRLIGRRNPNGWVLNPLDVEELSLIRDAAGGTANTGGFFWGGPGSAGGTSTLWGLPVIESEVIPRGTGYVGDWSRAILWDREQASVTASDSHENFFTRNLVAILAEMRAAFGVIQPNAFVEVDLTA